MSRYVNVKLLKKLMIDHDIETIGELSELSGINRNTLSDIVNDGYLPSGDTMIKLADTLDMEPEVAGSIFFAQELTE